MTPPQKEIIEQILERIEHLPTLPHVVMRVLQMAQSAHVNIEGISQALDQSLAAMVLKMANSAFYGGARPRSVKSIRHAIVIIGLDALKEIVLTASFFHTFHDIRDVQSLQPLWEHAQATAQIAKRLAWMYRYPNLDEAYFVGLIHDVGKLVIQQYFPDHYESIRQLIENGMDEAVAERSTVGLTHSDIGGKICNFWGFPESLSESIAHHHDGRMQNYPQLGRILYCADRYVLRHLGFKDVLEYFLSSQMSFSPQWDERDVEAVGKILEEELLKAKAIFSISNRQG